MGIANSKRECPLCKDDRHTSIYLMQNSPFVCTRCSTEWHTKTGAIEKEGAIPLREEKPLTTETISNSMSYIPMNYIQ